MITFYIGAVALRSGFSKGNDADMIWLSGAQCRGFETKLTDCPSQGLGTHACGHGSDVGVRCLAPTNCTDGDIRLQEATANQGIVEICFHNIWGRVCTDVWDVDNAQVACRQLGFTAAGK